MQLGIHAYAWCSEWSNNTLDILDTAKREGLDFLEIPLMKLEDFDPAAVRRRKDDVGIDVVTSNVILADEHDITSRNPEYRKNGIEYLKRCVDATAEVEGKCFSGVIYSQYCKADALPTEDDWKWSAEGLRAVGEHAQQYGITIGMEPVTRYESNLINTCEQALRLADRIGLDNVMVHLDSYHMNVEEKSFYEATRLRARRLGRHLPGAEGERLSRPHRHGGLLRHHRQHVHLGVAEARPLRRRLPARGRPLPAQEDRGIRAVNLRIPKCSPGRFHRDRPGVC